MPRKAFLVSSCSRGRTSEAFVLGSYGFAYAPSTWEVVSRCSLGTSAGKDERRSSCAASSVAVRVKKVGRPRVSVRERVLLPMDGIGFSPPSAISSQYFETNRLPSSHGVERPFEVDVRPIEEGVLSGLSNIQDPRNLPSAALRIRPFQSYPESLASYVEGNRKFVCVGGRVEHKTQWLEVFILHKT